jgi:transposase
VTTTKYDGRDDACPLYSCCLTDEQWQVIEPLLPTSRRGRPRIHRLRTVIDTILYVLRTGCAWRLAANDLAPWHVAYRCFRSWSAQGVWDDIHDVLRERVRRAEGRDPAPSAAVLDSQTVHSAEGGQDIGWDNAKKTRGRKRHLLVDTNGLLLICYLHAASVGDRTGAKQGAGLAGRDLPRHRAGVDRRWLRQQRRRSPHRLGRTAGRCEAAGRQTQRRCERLPGAATQVGSRAHLFVARPLPQTVPRLRTADRTRRRHGKARDDPTHAPAIDRTTNPLELTTLINQPIT